MKTHMYLLFVQARLVPGAVESLVQMLEWSGISIDEGNVTAVCSCIVHPHQNVRQF